MTIRDNNALAYDAAQATADQAQDQGNDEGFRFWSAVAAEIALRASGRQGDTRH